MNELAPRVLIIMSDQWPRALIRAALREVGYDAIGARNTEEARRYRAIEAGRGAVRLLVADHDAATRGHDELREIMAAHRNPPVLLVAHATRDVPEGPWSRVMRRPVSVADVVTAVQSLLPLAEEARRPVDTDGS